MNKKFTLNILFASWLVAASLVAGASAQTAGGTKARTAEISAAQVSPNVVISEVYGGAGCTTAGCSTYQNDFIELYNNGAAAVNLSGYSVQYAAASGAAYTVTALTGTIQPGTYYLIAGLSSSNGVSPLPTPNVTNNMLTFSATSGKVALVNSTTALAGACPTGNATIVDFVGYGTSANCAEIPTGTPSGNSVIGTPAAAADRAPTPSTTTSDQRTTAAGGGLTDTDTNGTDFVALAPTPQNTQTAAPTASSVTVGGRVTNASGRGLARARISMTDGGGNVYVAMTNPSGYYRFINVEAGQTLILTASGKGYAFTQPTQIVSLNDEQPNVNFTAYPSNERGR